MLERLATAAMARRRLVLVLALAFLALAGGIAGGVADRLSGGGFEDPASESEQGVRALAAQFGSATPNYVLVVTAPAGVDAPAAAAAGTALTQRLAAEPGVVEVVSYWTSGKAAPLRSKDGTKAIVLARLMGDDNEEVLKAEELTPRYAGAYDGLTVVAGGSAQVFSEVGTTIERDLIRAEAIAFPVVALLLVLVFGSAIAAALPLLVGVLSILGTFLALHLTVQVTDVSVYSVNLATSLGLGLGIDYALFMVTRYREELRAGRGSHEAVLATVRTAGRTVLFSALTVGLSLSALAVFPLYFLKSFAYAGLAAVFFALIGALVVLPAVLAMLGERINRYDLRAPLRRALRMRPPREKSLDEGMWHRIAMAVMRRPLPIATSVIVLLLVLGAPFLNVAFSLPDDRVLPRDAPAGQAGAALRTEFPGRELAALSVVAPVGDPAAVAPYATALSKVAGVERVDAFTGSYVDGRQVAPPSAASARYSGGGGTYLTVVPAIETQNARGEQLVDELRAVDAPYDKVLISGQAAELADTKDSLAARLPLALGLIGLATFVLLFLFTGSVVIPLKALVLNLLSLTATFGAMVWIFQDGNLLRFIGNPEVTGSLDTTTPILMFCVLFGLSMDYEVFLLSRIKEEYDATGDNRRAVALGLEKTGRLVSAAAALLALVFLAFVSSDITFIKLLGLGTALAVLVDATLIRGALVPAFMRLMGNANWWAPRPLRRLHDRFGLTEAEAAPAPRELVDA